MNTLDARRRMLGRNVYKKTTEGNPAIAQGSLSRMYPGIVMRGWTAQDNTTGAQLFDASSVVDGIISNGEVVENGSFATSDFISVIAGNVYSRSVTGATGNFFYNADKTYLQNVTGIVNIEAPEGAAYVRFSINKNDFDIQDIMLNEGPTALPWEPYTGGAPSPSPDYPQEIVSAGKWNEETQKYQYEVQVTGANLFNPNAEYVEGTYVGLPLHNKGKVSLILYEKNPDIDISAIFFGFTTTGYDPSEGFNWAIENGEYIGTIVNVVDDAYLSVYPKDKLDTVLEKYDVMVNYETEPLPYQPYKEQTVILTSDRPLTKWDKLTKKDGQWGWEYGSAEIVFDGSEDERWGFWINGFYIMGGLENILKNNTILMQSLCDKFSYTNPTSTDVGFIMTSTGGSYSPRFWINGLSDIANWRKFLSENNVIYLYPTETPTFTPLSASEQEALNALHTNRPTTVLSNDAGCEMSLTYKTRKSMEVTT